MNIVRLWTFIIIIITSIYSAFAADNVNILDEKCVQDEIVDCINYSLPNEIEFVNGVAGSNKVDAGFEDIGALYGPILSKFYSPPGLGNRPPAGCRPPYVHTRDFSTSMYCTRTGKLISISDGGDRARTSIYIPIQVINACERAIRSGFYGGQSCIQTVSFPNGADLENGLIAAFNKIADRIEGIGRQINEMADDAAKSPSPPNKPPEKPVVTK
ncbi:hypothetical protein [Ancylobacter sp.]|uniref:hypothetical protein n=1 Tax=Ancylobacter sp. TaxID=1872567 RepID=UPI003D10B009